MKAYLSHYGLVGINTTDSKYLWSKVTMIGKHVYVPTYIYTLRQASDWMLLFLCFATIFLLLSAIKYNLGIIHCSFQKSILIALAVY